MYPYYPCVALSGPWSFISTICAFSSVLHLSDCDQAFACTSDRTSTRNVFWLVCSKIDAIGVWIFTVLVVSLLILFSSLSCSLSLSVSVGVYMVCLYTAEVIGAVEYKRSFTHCARY